MAAEADEDKGRFRSLSHRIMLHRLQPQTEFKLFPFDFYCPSVRDKVATRICQKCGLYFATQAAMKTHLSVHNGRILQTISDEDQAHPLPISTCHVPVFENIFDLMKSPFIPENN